MYNICIFAGTTEGRELVEFLGTQPVLVTACVATEYGETLLPTARNIKVSAKRMDELEMEHLFRTEQFDMVVDATHPYAKVVTDNLIKACQLTETSYLRLLRESEMTPKDAIFVQNIAEAVEWLSGTQGNILLTTGSKELAELAVLPDFAERAYARVLPMEESLRLCREAGLNPAHILAVQGPFSREMNVAMLRSISAAYMLSKESGANGGFDEKVAAAREAGAKLVVIGRPPQREGLNLSETLRLLCQQFGLCIRPQVTVVGIGPGSEGAMTGEVRAAIADADAVIGAKRMVEAVAGPRQTVISAIAPQAIAEQIAAHPELRRFVVAMSGDVGFFSGAKKLLPLLKNCDLRVMPGLSSLAYLCARLGTSYEDVLPVSIHGREHDLVPDVRSNARIFTLVGGDDGMGQLCRRLTEGGLGHVRMSIGEELSYPNERIIQGTAAELAEQHFRSLSVALIENDQADSSCSFGLPDETFVRINAVPMTKSEVRAVCLSKLRLTKRSVCWDIGAGTGSVSVEMARLATHGQVYAIECNEEAVRILKQNRQNFGVEEQLEIVFGSAPDACAALPAPSHAFIGGSSGNLKQIISQLLEKNQMVRIVATAITLESISELTNCIKQFSFEETEIVSLSVARSREAGRFHLMSGQNPIYIFTMQGGHI